MGRLVGVARVRRLVVHVGGWRWAGFPGPSCPRAAAFLPDHAQLALATADGLGGEGQREAQQVHFTPEGIYLGGLLKKKEREGMGGRKMKTNDRKVRERAEKRVKRAEREMKTERVERKIICHLRQRIKASRRESYQATRRETALLKCWHSAVCESVRMCALSGAGRKLGPFFRIEGVYMSNSSDLAPSAFSANKGQLRQLLFWACESLVCRHAGAEHRISSENALV